MSDLPALTPLETPIFDDEIISYLEEILSSVCRMPNCDRRPAVRIAIRCCGANASYCAECAAGLRQTRAIMLAKAATRCATCGHSFAAGTDYSAVYEEVQL